MTQQTDFAKFFLHTPAQSSTNFVWWAEKLKQDTGIDYGCVLDKYVIPLHPGDLMAIVARPGHGKSSMMAYLARRAAQKIIASGDTQKCVVYVSWEQSVEEIEAFFQSGYDYTSTDLAWGRADLDNVKRGAVKRVNLPIWMIGYSIKDADKRKPTMTIEAVYESIRAMKFEYNYEPTLVCLDYLQIIPVDKKMERTKEVTEATIQAKHLAMEIGVPIVAGVQASREADNRKNQPPAMSDAQWSSAIEQNADKQISLLKPSKILPTGEDIEVGSHNYTVDDRLLVIKLLKQRFDSGTGIWAVRFESQSLTMTDYNIHELN